MNHEVPGDEKALDGAPATGRTTEDRGDTTREAPFLLRVVVIVAILAAGLLGMAGMILLKEDPAEAKVVERTLAVKAMKVVPENVPVTVSGLGEVRSLNIVPVSPEIPGLVVEIYPHLEVGELVPRGALLFKIDPRDYIAARDRAQAQADQMEKTRERLTRQYALDQERLQTLERNDKLMQEEFSRVKSLYEQDDVGTQSAVDHAEMTYNQTADARDQLSQVVSLYPVQIQEAESGLKAAQAQLSMAEANLARTEVRAPFDARVKSVMLEEGQYVNPGSPVLTLADDSILEISVSLDSRDARDWLQFEDGAVVSDSSWFGALKPVTCSIAWTEDPGAHRWEGTLHRIESFDPKTRTVSVAVRITAEAARASTGGLPLVEGMFCQVGIPGKEMEQVYRLPRWAVTYEGNAYLVHDGRLIIQEVSVLRSEGESTFVNEGLKPGDQVITTRLVNPLPNSRISIEAEEAVGS